VPPTIFCIATYRKGDEFLRECRRQGCRVLLMTDEQLEKADWPREAVDEFYYVRRGMPAEDIRKGLAYVARTESIDRIVALDDFDVELAAMLREYLRIPGMGETTARAFRDKLTMRTRARSAGIACPEFIHVLNHKAIDEWTARVPAPWVLKPRSQAAAIGIRKLHSADELWPAVERLGDAGADYLLERFVPGDVYHLARARRHRSARRRRSRRRKFTKTRAPQASSCSSGGSVSSISAISPAIRFARLPVRTIWWARSTSTW
jgi:glutathione synthase/RimK-type ligase-like ATP-grasp enzyme